MSLLRDLQKYAITKDFFEEFYRPLKDDGKKSMSNVPQKSQLLANVPPNVPPKVEKEKVNKSQDNYQTANTYNSLFWTFYALIKNEHELSMQETHKFKMKNDFALKFIEELKSNKPFIKQNKLKFHDIESSILYDKDISLMTLKALILFNKMNIIYIWNNKYYIFESNDDDAFQVIERHREKYSFDRDIPKEEILQGKAKNKFMMEDVRTQLKSMSSYKLEELQSIASMFGIPLENSHKKKKTKQLLYEEINSKID
jgi:hypothetical protein